jgi:hypothetical protein
MSTTVLVRPEAKIATIPFLSKYPFDLHLATSANLLLALWLKL